VLKAAQMQGQRVSPAINFDQRAETGTGLAAGWLSSDLSICNTSANSGLRRFGKMAWLLLFDCDMTVSL
jgi:hypothetical protein